MKYIDYFRGINSPATINLSLCDVSKNLTGQRCEIITLGKKIMDYHREGAAKKAATGLRLFVEMDQDSEWKLAA